MLAVWRNSHTSFSVKDLNQVTQQGLRSNPNQVKRLESISFFLTPSEVTKLRSLNLNQYQVTQFIQLAVCEAVELLKQDSALIKDALNIRTSFGELREMNPNSEKAFIQQLMERCPKQGFHPNYLQS